MVINTPAPTYSLSRVGGSLKRSIMRDLLKHAVDPNILSLAGGLPASDGLPVHEYAACLKTVIARDGAKALQYAPMLMPLREWIATYMQGLGVQCTAEQIFITNGNQQGLSILTRLFLDPGDTALIENIVFTGIQQAIQAADANIVAVPTDPIHGIDLDALERGMQRGAKLAVVIPDFHNPLGVTLSAESRERIAQMAAHYGVPVVEDDAYSALRFAGDPLPPVKAYDEAGWVFYMGSFSKMLAPGLRLGWMIVPEELLPKVMVLREAIDLESATLTQRAVTEYVTQTGLAHLPSLRAMHQERYLAMNQALETHFGDFATWTRPEGGIFVWLTLPEHINTWRLLNPAIEAGVVYVPGSAFAVNGGATNTMRLNFSTLPAKKIAEAVERLAAVVKKQSSTKIAKNPKSIV